jgi:hypothetical protein
VIHKEGLCPSSGDINRLLMIIVISRYKSLRRHAQESSLLLNCTTKGLVLFGLNTHTHACMHECMNACMNARTHLQSKAHRTMHFGYFTVLISRALALISNCQCIAKRVVDRSHERMNAQTDSSRTRPKQNKSSSVN